MKKPFKVLATLGIAASLFTSMPGMDVDASGHTGYVEVKASNLYLRADDSFTSKAVRVLHKGERYKVYGKSNGMYNLGGNQWTSANSKYVSYTANNTSNEQSVEGTVTIKVNDLYVRSDASFSSKPVKVVHKGQMFKVYGKKNGLYHLGGNQWVTASSKYVSYQSGSQPVATAKPAVGQTVNGKVQITVHSLNIRSTASFSSKVVGVAMKGQTFNVYEERNGLYRIGNGKWISANSKYVTTNVKTTTSTPSVATVSSSKAEDVVNFGKRYIGMKYVWASSHPSNGGFDCSGFIYYVYKNNGYDINRLNVVGYWNAAKKINTPEVGDLVFFKDTYKPGPSHMGIYLGDGKFLNANSSKGVSVDSLNNSYWKKHFLGYGKF